VLGLRSGFHRWTAAQQEEFADTLAEVAGDPERDVHGTLSAVTALAALPAVPPDRLAALAAVDGAQPARDAALRALATHDSGAGIPVLLDALEDERASVAVYALGPAVRAMPPARALQVLRGIGSGRLSVAKEVARLLGELPDGAGHPDLVALAGSPGLHRDLRVAVLRALWEHVERPGTLAVLEAAVVDPDPAVAGAVVRIPVDRATAGARRAGRELLAGLLRHPSERVRIEALRRCRAVPLGDPDDVLGPPLLAALDSALLDEVQAAADTVLHGYAERDPDRIGAAVGRILAERRAVEVVLVSLGTSARWQRERYTATVRTVLDRLATDPLTAAHRAHLAVVGLAAAEAAERLRGQARDATLHADAVAAACTAVGGWHGPGFRSELESALAVDPDERLRRIALAALVADAERSGWDSGRRERLDAYRADPSPLVAGAAQFTFPPDDGRE